jgi:hypothetical protein
MFTPRQLLNKALANRRNPWNWLLHLLGLVFFLLALLFHSSTLFGLAIGLGGIGLLNLHLPAGADNAFTKLAQAGLELEDSFRAMPRGWRKWLILSGLLVGAFFSVWALWTRAVLALCLLAGFGILARVAALNRANGIRL